MERNHGELSYELTQFLSGHGGYRAYLYRFGHDESPCCPRCGNVAENAEHVVFECPTFTAHRTRLEAYRRQALNTLKYSGVYVGINGGLESSGN